MIMLNERRHLGHLKPCNRKTVVVFGLRGGNEKTIFKNLLESNDFVYSHLFFPLSLILCISSTYNMSV